MLKCKSLKNILLMFSIIHICVCVFVYICVHMLQVCVKV